MALKASRDRLISLESCCEMADQAMINAAQDEIEVNVRILLPPANEVWGKVIFLHLSVILFTRGGLPQCMLGYHPRENAPPRTMHPPGPWTSPGTMHPSPSGTMHTPPQDHAHTPRTMHSPQGPCTPPPRTMHPLPGTMHPPGIMHPPAQSILGDTVNARAVRILLECNFVFSLKMKI